LCVDGINYKIIEHAMTFKHTILDWALRQS